MGKIEFISAKPFLSIACNSSLKSIQFINHRYSTEDPKEIKLLSSYKGLIAEAKSVEAKEFIKEYERAEAERIEKAQKAEKEKQEKEIQNKENHELYSLLRMV